MLSLFALENIKFEKINESNIATHENLDKKKLIEKLTEFNNNFLTEERILNLNKIIELKHKGKFLQQLVELNKEITKERLEVEKQELDEKNKTLSKKHQKIK